MIQPAKQWTFLHYNAGQGQLAEIGTHALQQLESIGSDENTDVVALNYREHTPLGRFEEYEGGRTYHVQKCKDAAAGGELRSLVRCALTSPAALSSPELARPIEAGEAAKMSDPATLKAFLLDSMKRFPAQHFALAITGHGAAFQGQAITRGPEGRKAITNDQLGKVLREVREETGQGVDLVNLNTCYSANLETLYSLKDATKTVVASQDELAMGTQPFAQVLAEVQQQLSEGATVEPSDLGRLFVQHAARQPMHTVYSPTLTAVNTAALDALGESVAALQTKCQELGIRPGQVRECLEQAVGVDFAPGVELTDIGSLAKILGERFPQLRETTGEVEKRLQEAVVAEQHSTPEQASRLAKLVRKLPGVVGPQKDLTGATGLTVFWNAQERERLALVEDSAYGRAHPVDAFMEYLRGE